MQASRDRCRSAILEIIMLGSLRVGRWGATSKIGFDHVGEDDARLGDIEGSDGRVHLVETLAAAICGKTRAGKFQIKQKTRRDRMRAKLKMIKEEMWWRMHQPIPAQGKWLWYVVNGYFNYHAVPTNARALHVFRHHITDLWRRMLRQRSQKDGMTWVRMTQLVDDWLPKPIILHPWPSVRFAVTHPRWEPYAGKPHVRFWCSE